MNSEVMAPDEAPDAAAVPQVVDHIAVARLYGEPLFQLPQDLYIPPDALEVFLEAFEGPLDLLLYLIRKQNFNILDIPMAAVTRQYLQYVDEIRERNLELAAEYLLMAAMLIEIKSRMLLPPKKTADGQEPEDPRAELVRRLVEYERMKLAAANLDQHRLLRLRAGLLPFIKAVGRNKAAALSECAAKRGLRGDAFCAGVDHPVTDLGVVGPRGNQPPVHGGYFAAGRRPPDGGDRLRWGDVIAGP